MLLLLNHGLVVIQMSSPRRLLARMREPASAQQHRVLENRKIAMSGLDFNYQFVDTMSREPIKRLNVSL